MSFLSPMVLAGLAAIGVPVLIHLLNKFRTRVTEWGAMRLLAETVQKNRRRVKLDDLLLLILRCLVVALAVLAFARPVLKGVSHDDAAGGPVAAVVILDQSASMAQTSGAVSRFDLARQDIRKWLDQQDTQSLVGFYLAATRTTPVIGKPANDFGLFRKSLDEAAVGDYGSDLSQSLRLAVESLKDITGRPREIRIYTDGQAAAFQHPEEMKKLAHDHPEIVIRPIIVGGAPEANLGLVALRAERGIPSLDQPVRFHVEVMNSGAAMARGVTVDFSVDGGTSVGTVSIPAIASGETQGANTAVTFTKAGPHRVTATIAADGFAADNQRVAAVEVASRMEVAIAENDPTEAAMGRSGFFLSKGLVPVPKEQKSHYYLSPLAVKTGDLPGMLSQPASRRPSVVFLCDPGTMSTEVANALEAYVKSGGNLAVFPGAGNEAATWEKQEQFSKLLPGTLAAAVVSPPESPVAWQANGFTHPVTSLWNDPANGNLGTVKFARHCPMTLKPAAASAPSVVVAYADGQPAVAEWSYGAGSVVLFSAAVTQDWTNESLHPSFVPFLQRLMGWFNRHTEAKLVLAPGEAFRKPVDEAHRGKDFSIRRPGAETARTAGQVTPDDKGGGYIRYAATDRTGAYEVGIGDDAVATFAVQMDPAESDLRAVAPEVLAGLSEVPRDAAGAQARSVVLKDYWSVAIWSLAALFIAEAVMAHRNSHARA